MIQVIGPHRVRCGDVMDSAGLAELMDGVPADIIYSDPPWGRGNLKFWRTMNLKMTGQDVPQPELETFLQQIFSLAARYGRIFLVEYGVRWEEAIKARGLAHGFSWLGRATPVYGHPARPLHLHLFAKGPVTLPPDYFQLLDGTTGLKTVLLATAPFAKPDGIVLDMCCGLGYSAQMALHYQMRFRGNELNAKRLESTIARLRKGV